MVNKLYVSTKFIRSIHKLKKKNISLVRNVREIVDKLINGDSVQQYHPHPMQRHKDIIELHVHGDILLTYSYRDDVLSISLDTYGLDKHDTLNRNLKSIKKMNMKEYELNTKFLDEDIEDEYEVYYRKNNKIKRLLCSTYDNCVDFINRHNKLTRNLDLEIRKTPNSFYQVSP